jgi:protein-S-isoprenylcysteine O-methyltransferase Ste14
MNAQEAAVVALVGYTVFVLLAFGLRSLAHYRRTGSSGFVGISGRPGSAEWFGGSLFVVSLLAAPAAPLLALAGVAPIAALTLPGAHAVGILLFVVGVGGTLWAQCAMGDSWRVGVDTGARTALVVTGPFRWVRNPIYTAMTVATLGLVFLVPNAAAALAFVSLVAALEIQVRLVEEPYLMRAHGTDYRRYATSTGRFVPGLGRVTD